MNSNKLKNLLPLMGIVFLVVYAVCGCDNDPGCPGPPEFEASDSFEYEAGLAGHDSFQLVGINGSIEIIGVTDAVTVEIWGEKTVRAGSQSLADDLLDDVQIQISETGNRIIVRTVQPTDNGERDFEVDYHVRIPRSWLVDVQHINGAVTISTVDDAVHLSLINGDADLTEVSGDVNVHVTNGQVAADVTPPATGTCRIVIINGTIVLDLPQLLSAAFSAFVVNGTVQVAGFDLTGWTTTPTSMIGTIGSGDGTVSLQATNGSIVVNGV